MNLETAFKVFYQQKWIVGVSGGADSMTLLDLAFKQGLLIEVVHVHYHQRASADYDCALVERYCKQHAIEFHRFDAPHFRKGNFQQRAREFRYTAFKQVVRKTNACGVMVGHHMDDVIETYLFQKQRQTNLSYYGIQFETTLKRMRVVRPLLSASKEDILTYCKTHELKFALDESNQSDKYTRNQLRKELDQYSFETKQSMLKDIDTINRELQTTFDRFTHELQSKQLTQDQLNHLCSLWPDFFVHWLRKQANLISLSKAHGYELLRQITSVPSVVIPLNHRYRLIKQYGRIRTRGFATSKSILFNRTELINKTWIKIRSNPTTSAYKLQLDKTISPIQVINAYAGMNLLDLDTQHKLRRIWINHKIDYEKREDWPLFFNDVKEFIGSPLLFQKGCFKTDKIELYVII